MSRENREALRSKKSQRCLKEEKKEWKDQSKRDNAEHHVYRIYGTCKQSSRQSDCGKLMVGFGKCVSERHGAQTEHFVEGCQSNRTKENDEATSIMLTYHSKRQKRTMRSFKNKTSNAWVAYREGTDLITFESRKKTRFTWHWSQKSLMMNSLFKNQHHSYCLTHLCRPKFMLTWARLEQRPSGAYMLS